MQHGGAARPEGSLALRVIHNSPEGMGIARPLTRLEIIENALPRRGLSDEVNAWRAANIPNIRRAARTVGRARRKAVKYGLPHFWSQLWLAKITPEGRRIELGLASMRVVTTAGVNFIVDAFQNLTEVELFRFHGIGTGTNAEAVGDTALQTELTTQYNPDNTRATGSLTEGASANIFRTVGTNTVDAAAAITEHGILTQAATGGGTLLDRSVFAVINLGNGDSLESTYDLTVSAGG